ncbi:prolyl oligopeptidase family serine peptidase [Sphingobacterium sp. SYP-B4668]|uniref:carboxylesterase family protein n=1 Tax=Sphingobacterium sp. SYP-B4668 TaxID=2996035 RepID=UPI0022DE035D|nr:prolyl oligopeptidase family serine peptidase [Sphingobacterium sp. SYP-B4668]
MQTGIRSAISLLCLIVVTGLYCHAQPTPVTGETDYPFMIQLPSQEILDNNPPILVFLHGRSLSGTNLNRVTRYGVLYAMAKGQQVPAIVIAPQSKGGWDPDKVMEVVDYTIEKYKADSSRVYVAGMSMGGYGTMDVAGKYPDRVAAAVAICGGGTLSYAQNLTKVPLWIQHGNKDRIVPMSESKKIVNAIKKADPDADVTLTIISGGNHGSVERLFHADDIYDWMFKHVKE